MAFDIEKEAEEALTQFLTTAKDGMVKDMTNKGLPPYTNMNASGDTARTFAVRVQGTTGILLGPEHILTMERGRKPTQNAGGGGMKLIDMIKQWIRDKGVIIPDGFTFDSFAFVITRKIHRDGTRMWRQLGRSGGTTGFIEDNISEESIKNFAEVFSKEAFTGIQSNIKERLKTGIL